MRIITARNAHQALPKALDLLDAFGVERGSRNGQVRVAPTPITTEYSHPLERVVFWPQRDANPFFHLYEALWMLGGRDDLAPLTRFVSTFGAYSDDGKTLRGAYGARWRSGFGYDQLSVIAERLRADATDRRSVLAMWDGEYDLGADSKDVPCNLLVTFQRSTTGALDMTVFCRSNDIIWGAYGANAVHFGFLLEYMAIVIGCEPGTYRQISVNWHAYAEPFQKLKGLVDEAFVGLYAQPTPISDPYIDEALPFVPLAPTGTAMLGLDARIQALLEAVDRQNWTDYRPDDPFFRMAAAVLEAHHLYKTREGLDRYEAAYKRLADVDPCDWVVAAGQWLERRHEREQRREEALHVQA